MNTFNFALIFTLVTSTSWSTEKSSMYVGFWEKEGVRQVFEFKEKKWQSLLLEVNSTEALKKAASQFARPTQWTLFFDGKTYGRLSTKSYTEYNSYKEVGLQKLTSNAPNLAFRKSDKRFSDWNGQSLRPILVSSLNDVTDPEGWKSTSSGKIDPFILKDLKVRLKGKINVCKDKNCEDSTTTRDPKDSEIILVKSYKNSSGSQLQSVVLKFSAKDFVFCELEGDECKNQEPFWYFSKPSKGIKFLTKAAALIDAADLNQDNSTDFLFWINEYNLNGYEIVDGQSHAQQRATWSYH